MLLQARILYAIDCQNTKPIKNPSFIQHYHSSLKSYTLFICDAFNDFLQNFLILLENGSAKNSHYLDLYFYNKQNNCQGIYFGFDAIYYERYLIFLNGGFIFV